MYNPLQYSCSRILWREELMVLQSMGPKSWTWLERLHFQFSNFSLHSQQALHWSLIRTNVSWSHQGQLIHGWAYQNRWRFQAGPGKSIVSRYFFTYLEAAQALIISNSSLVSHLALLKGVSSQEMHFKQFTPTLQCFKEDFYKSRCYRPKFTEYDGLEVSEDATTTVRGSVCVWVCFYVSRYIYIF